MWPAHGNAPLAIAASFMLMKNAQARNNQRITELEIQRGTLRQEVDRLSSTDWPKEASRLRARVGRQRHALRQLNKAHAALWRVIGLRDAEFRELRPHMGGKPS
jgi:uncharacterized coiled-coil protein SlyX